MMQNQPVSSVSLFDLNSLDSSQKLLCTHVPTHDSVSFPSEVASFVRSGSPCFYDPLLKSYFDLNPGIYTYPPNSVIVLPKAPDFFKKFLESFPSLKDPSQYKWQIVNTINKSA